MTLPFALPDWVPWWLAIALLAPLLLYALAVLVMPFAVLSMKARLDTIDLRLDELHGEIRGLALRMREPVGARANLDENYVDPPGTHRPSATPSDARPPVPPATPPARPPVTDARTGRAEPRLNWPR